MTNRIAGAMQGLFKKAQLGRAGGALRDLYTGANKRNQNAAVAIKDRITGRPAIGGIADTLRGIMGGFKPRK